jgi:hypothetical protein
VLISKGMAFIQEVEVDKKKMSKIHARANSTAMV